ncbi:hypothetical protein BATDEDRAFT_33795 [Batrachochytrium dendrobatidis JAM81]|uniref:C2H2-type domain-containing protein n=2 Tax=Batrachochytrium dendrobatidis TaxID=109871 RepID=F4PD91_BATDJ|nr:uncharacterized protein BATDEDRAFT_33795 [Batrachochytrium dendrobatidis JAM81]EGF76749.1 hypothetical protein BATDEDRAFT_33795 [Batrachochytrium dendrobatidis JAM81]|eukprot:XP_006682648.1 hypothetical protein BATDEDRAFT_33795 [Batrachochytrium dendrobatidis JAM81]
MISYSPHTTESTLLEPHSGASTIRFTCLSCHVAFPTADAQRAHMKTDWHRYNLKRKAADLPPITAETFAQKLQEQQLKSSQQQQQAMQPNECHICNKVYASTNAYKSHLASRKHRDMQVKVASTPVTESSQNDQPVEKNPEKIQRANWQERLIAATTQDEFEAIMKEKMEAVKPLEETDCLFCCHAADSFELNLEHMTKAHSFFIPDATYLVDVKGLIKYLADKIAIANVCIFCNGKGRAMHSTEAAQHHMISKDHCKMAYENGEDEEYADFYDFSPMYSDEETNSDEEWEDVAEAMTTTTISGRRRPTRAHISENEVELTLPSGISIGHRSFRTYWKQNLRHNEVVAGSRQDPEMIRLMSGQHNLLEHTTGNGLSSMSVAAHQQLQMHKIRQRESRLQHRREYEFRTKIGFIGNSQKHLVDPSRPT